MSGNPVETAGPETGAAVPAQNEGEATGRRRWLPRRRREAAQAVEAAPLPDAPQLTKEAAAQPEEPAAWPATEPVKRRRFGSYEADEETIFTSSRQAGALNPAIVSTHPPLAGPITGIDMDTGQPVSTDPHELYDQKRITSPNVVVLGDISSGKSSLVKTQYCVRPVALGRQVAVFDRKDQQGAGEYQRAAELAGVPVIRFARAGGTAINLLDPRISATSLDESGDERVGQDRLLLMVAEHAHGRLSSTEHYALRVAHRAALERARAENRVATLHDVVDALYDPQETAVPRRHLLQREIVTTDRVIEWGLELAMDLERFIDGDLSGLIDRETSASLDLDAPLLVFDTSALPEESPALALVMALVATFLTAVWAHKPGQRIIILEEGYHTTRLQSPGTTSVATILRSLAKRGRGIGLSFVTVLHHISDVPKDSDAMSLVREADIIHIYQQSRAEDAQEAVTQFRLPSTLFDTLGALDKGCHILRIGKEAPRRVRHIRTRLETWMTDTDEAMTGRRLVLEETT
ncbi:hypothetical protein [Kitasatospora sp. NBC_01302]|uniref:hypothetical protein n=1 Tax=Kitasatospora sp. NBC_01302 TaxID=2903575 RepID=UPI002E1338BF|nr:hypothetical protein OG294_40895 [Kitasatospora sp. NBC_01302]